MLYDVTFESGFVVAGSGTGGFVLVGSGFEIVGYGFDIVGNM